MSDFDVIVVGGGVIGLASAWRLAQRGLRVAVIERGEPGGGTSHVAAGMLAPVAEADPAEERLLRLGMASAQVYPSFVAELEQVTGVDAGYLPCGTLLAARDRDDAEAIEQQLEIRERLGLKVTRLRPSEARRLEPALAPTLRAALALPDDHVIDPRRLTAALAEAVRRGGELRPHTEVVAVEPGEGVLLRGGRRLSAPRVVVAAGAWSAAIAGIPAHAQVAIRPVKGQIMRLHDPAGPGLLTRVLRMPGPVYLAPRGDGRYVLGGSVEEKGFDTTVTAGAMFDLLREVIELVPGASELVIDELSAGIRPGTPDNVPVIGRGAVDGLYWATGHYRNGVLLAPITAQLVANAVVGEGVEAGVR